MQDLIDFRIDQIQNAEINKKLENSAEKELEKYRNIKKKIKEYQKIIRNNFEYVGKNFAYEARSIHYNKKNKKKGIYGTASQNELKELNIKKIPVIQKLDEAKRNLKIELNIDQKNLKKERDLSIKRASNTKKVTIKTFFKKELASLEKKRIAVQALLLKNTKDIEKSFQSKKKSEEMLYEKIKNKSPLISKLENEIKTWENSLAKSKAIQDKLNNLEVQRSDWEEYIEKERLIRDSKVNDLVKNIKRKEKKRYKESHQYINILIMG